MPRRWFLSVALSLLSIGGSVASAAAQSEASDQTETLIKGKIESGFVFAIDEKLSSIDGDFANFVGFHTGWLVNHKFLLGLAAYGSTDAPHGLDEAYGGLQLEYFFNPNKLFNYSVRGLIGGGGVDSYGHRGHHSIATGFFVFEPEARVTLNLLRPVRIGFGLGYRFTEGGAGSVNPGGPTFSISFKFGKF